MDISYVAEAVRQRQIQPKDIKLLPYQVKHFYRIIDEILPYQEGYLDGSITGTGKSIITAAVSLTYDMILFVICPFTVIKVWRDVVDAFNLKCLEIMSYEKFAGRTKSNVSVITHNYLVKHKQNYLVSDNLLKLLSQQNILFVFDECQYIKNQNTARFKACRAITNTLSAIRSRSRFAALSASPFDKIEYSLTMLRLFGILQSHQLYTKRKETHQVYLLGLQEIIDFAREVNSTKTRSLLLCHQYKLQYENINQETARGLVFEFYDCIIKDYIGSSLPRVKISEYNLYVYEGYFKVAEDDQIMLRTNISLLKGIVDPLVKDLEKITINHLEMINRARQHIEAAKNNLFQRLAVERLASQKRVIIAYNFNKNIRQLANLLADYSPLILTGKTTNRNEIIDNFQHPCGRRLLIVNIKVAGQGLNFHDLYGNRETHLLISSNYSIISIFQMVGRIYRTGVKSDAYAYLVYGKETGCCETHIMQALVKKVKPLKASIPSYHEQITNLPLNKILLPGEYPQYIEE